MIKSICFVCTGNICTNRLKMLYLRDFRLLTSNRLLGIYQHFTNKNNSVFLVFDEIIYAVYFTR